MRSWALDLLRCPEAGEPLSLAHVAESTDGEVVTGTLRSASGREYPIRGRVPRFTDNQYASSFGYQWNVHARTQLDDRRKRHSDDRFFGETGFDRDALRGKLVLDVGCGSGRFAAVAAQSGARVVAVDLSDAVNAAADNLKQYSDVVVVQGSVYALPFSPRSFDFVYCLGVIQHTPEPLRAVAALAQAVRAGGQIGLWWYKRYWWTPLNQKYILRPILTRVPQETLYRWIRWYVPLLLPLSRLLMKVRGFGPPYNLAHNIIPVAARFDIDGLSPEEVREWSILDTFDWYAPAYDLPQRWSDVEAVLASEFQTRRTPRRGLNGVRLAGPNER